MNRVYKYGFFLLLNIALFFIGRKAIQYTEHHLYLEERAKSEFKRLKADTVKYFVDRNNLFRDLGHDSLDIVFLGDSHFQFFELSEMLGSPNLKNRGISGDISLGVLNRIDDLLQGNVDQLFFLIGTNDLIRRLPVDSTAKVIDQIIHRFLKESPSTEIYLHTVFPINDEQVTVPSFNDHVLDLNEKIKETADRSSKVVLIDLYEAFRDDNQLNKEYTYDGIHLNYNGYLKWTQIIKEYLRE